MESNGTTPTLNQIKRAAAESAATIPEDGMTVGLGSGSTARFAIDALGKRIREGLRIVGVPTSEATAEQARAAGIPLSTLAEHGHVDLTIDGADQVELGALNLIKGLGGALLREKIVACASARLVIVVDESKLVKQLGAGILPVEVVRFGWQATARRLRDMGAFPSLRLDSEGVPFISDCSNYILDCKFDSIASPESLDRRLNAVVGVIEHGLFLGLTHQVFVGRPEGVQILSAGAGRSS